MDNIDKPCEGIIIKSATVGVWLKLKYHLGIAEIKNLVTPQYV